MTPPARPQRADAVRNRTRILDATRELVVERGADVTMEEIAGEAGVAVGTLYRNFPTKADLINAVVTATLETLAESIEAAVSRVQAGSTSVSAEILAIAEYAITTNSDNQVMKAIAKGLGTVGTRVAPVKGADRPLPLSYG